MFFIRLVRLCTGLDACSSEWQVKFRWRIAAKISITAARSSTQECLFKKIVETNVQDLSAHVLLYILLTAGVTLDGTYMVRFRAKSMDCGSLQVPTYVVYWAFSITWSIV